MNDKIPDYIKEQIPEEDLKNFEEHGNVVGVCDDCMEEKKANVKHNYHYGDYIKAPFLANDGMTEYMWVEVRIINRDTIIGILDNNPTHPHDFECGAEVEIKREDIVQVIKV